MDKLELTLNKEKQLIKIAGEHFTFDLNGYNNAVIRQVLAGLGIDVKFVQAEASDTGNVNPDAVLAKSEGETK